MEYAAPMLEWDIETLRHGGSEAISRFMQVSERLYEEGGADALQSWVTIAAPVLPESERVEVVTMLLRELFEASERGDFDGADDPKPTLN